MAPQYSELVDLLIEGARFDDAEDVQSALDQGADINSQDEQGRTGKFIMNAAHFSSEFLSHSTTTPLSSPPLPPAPFQILFSAAVHMAAANGHAELLQNLIDRGAVRISAYLPRYSSTNK